MNLNLNLSILNVFFKSLVVMALPPIARGGNPSGRGLEDSGIINGSEMIAGNSCLIFFFVVTFSL